MSVLFTRRAGNTQLSMFKNRPRQSRTSVYVRIEQWYFARQRGVIRVSCQQWESAFGRGGYEHIDMDDWAESSMNMCKLRHAGRVNSEQQGIN